MTYDLARIPTQPEPHKSYQEYLDEDRNPVPDHFRETATAETGTGDVSVERYIDRAFYDRERGMWDRVWQAACREEHIPNPGDYHVYEIARRSYLVVRTPTGDIKAYPNACLHRGRKLREESGHTDEFRCPFHGYTWGLDGDCVHIPCPWDFPQVDTAKFQLPEVQTGTWAGWVFINPDSNAEPLEDYLDPINSHFAPYLWEQSFLGVHVGKVLDGNWKVIQEAFMESFHALDTHPQIMSYVDDFGCQYDQWAGKPHVNRMMVPFAAPSTYVVDQVTEQEALDGMTGQSPDGDTYVRVPEGATARQTFADASRKNAQAMTGRDLSNVSDAELADGWYYNVFPNLMHWGGYGPNLWYRFRPYQDNHEQTLMEVGYILRHPEDQPKPEPPEMVFLDVNTPWASVPELGSLGGVLDQDTTNMTAVQQGLNATFKPGVTLANSQESRIRHWHQTLDAYLKR